MHILFFNRNIYGEGTFRRCFFLGRYLVRYGHSVLLTCVSSKPTIHMSLQEVEGVRILNLPNLGSQYTVKEIPIHVIRGLINSLLEVSIRFDIIHAYAVSCPTTAMPILFHKILKNMGNKHCKIFVDWDDLCGKEGLAKGCGRIIETITTLLEEKVPLLVDGVTVVSEMLRKKALNIGISPHKVYKISNGANIDFISQIPKDFARKKIGLNTTKSIIVYEGGSGIPSSCIKVLIKAFQMLKSNYDILLIFLGSFPHEQMILAQNLIKKFKLRNNVLFTGRIPYENIPLFLAASDILLLPMEDSLKEWARWPGRLGDYLAAGRPIVAGAVGEVKEVIFNGKCGLLFEPGNAEDFAEKINILIENHQMREEMGRRARLIAEGEYAWQNIAKKLENVYQSLNV